ncbi:MAG: CRTAC1 family protein [Limisphaerales bacterium]
MNHRPAIIILLAAGAFASAGVLLRLALRSRVPETAPATQSVAGTSTSRPPQSPAADPALGRISPELAARWLALESRERQVAETTWAVESLAASCGAVLENLWDRLNASTSRWETLADFPFDQLIAPAWAFPSTAVPSLQTTTSRTQGEPLAHPLWRDLIVGSVSQSGWTLLQAEFRHSRFETNASGSPARSRFDFSAHMVRESPPARAVLEGPLNLTWAPRDSVGEAPRVALIDASGITLRVRDGPPPFRLVHSAPVSPTRHSLSVDPLIAHDLDGDGGIELLAIAANQIHRRNPDGTFRTEPISPALSGMISAAVLGDFDGDERPDLMFQGLRTLEWVRGLAAGRFSRESRTAWTAPSDVRNVMTLTAGDFDGNGTLDVFLGQYKEPYEGGSSPTPFHDANDGLPAYLLANRGDGTLTDVTSASFPTIRRHRRMYSASWADLDADGDLDLMTANDFAGLDLYRNDGRGRLEWMTENWVRNPRAFGMAHTLADFNADGLLDLLMIGMTSPTVDRLEHLGLRRPESHQDANQRAPMTHGNRLYLARPEGGFVETGLGDSLARSGWSWGCAAADFDNDGFPDVAIGNGLETRTTVRDYESEYWLHDQHVGTSEDDPAAYLYFKSKIARTRGRGQSYGGYEKNRLYLNRAGIRFEEVGHLLGVALEQDTRNVLAEDVDSDGRMDLIVLSYEKWPDPKPTLRVFRNELTDIGHWIGFRIPGAPPGTRVRITTPTGSQVRQILAGDSYRSQPSSTVHFGLGTFAGPVRVTIRPPGRVKPAKTAPEPDFDFELEPDRYHRIAIGGAGGGGRVTGTE